jgi:hypothetical protein
MTSFGANIYFEDIGLIEIILKNSCFLVKTASLPNKASPCQSHCKTGPTGALTTMVFLIIFLTVN